MRTPNEFWLCLHELARAIDAEGRNDDERRANIVASLEQMPATVRGQVVSELIELMNFLPDLYPHAIAAQRKPKTPGERQPAAGNTPSLNPEP
jgi:hypothetical protein